MKGLEGQGEEACEGAGWASGTWPIRCRVVLIEGAEQVERGKACDPIRVGVGQFGEGVGEGEDGDKGV